MTKAERILQYIHKIAQKQGIDYERALDLAIVQSYINYIEHDEEIFGDQPCINIYTTKTK